MRECSGTSLEWCSSALIGCDGGAVDCEQYNRSSAVRWTPITVRACRWFQQPLADGDRGGSLESAALQGGDPATVEGDGDRPERHQSPAADQSEQEHAGDDAAGGVAEGCEAKSEADLDGAATTGEERYAGDELGDHVSE